jgi:hypothetical protein
VSDPWEDVLLALREVANARGRRRVAQWVLEGFMATDPRLWRPPKKLRLGIRCTARRTNGEPCQAFAVRGTWVCVAHGGKARHVREAARSRLWRLSAERKFRRMFDASQQESWAVDAANMLMIEAEAAEAGQDRAAS